MLNAIDKYLNCLKYSHFSLLNFDEDNFKQFFDTHKNFIKTFVQYELKIC